VYYIITTNETGELRLTYNSEKVGGCSASPITGRRPARRWLAAERHKGLPWSRAGILGESYAVVVLQAGHQLIPIRCAATSGCSYQYAGGDYDRRCLIPPHCAYRGLDGSSRSDRFDIILKLDSLSYHTHTRAHARTHARTHMQRSNILFFLVYHIMMAL